MQAFVFHVPDNDTKLSDCNMKLKKMFIEMEVSTYEHK